MPLHVNREVPSGITPFPCVALILPQRFVLPDLQNLHSLHSGVLYANVSGEGKKDGEEDKNVLKSYNVISWLDGCHALADGLDYTSSFMTEHDREGSLGILAGKCICICEAPKLNSVQVEDCEAYRCGRLQCSGFQYGLRVPLVGQLRWSRCSNLCLLPTQPRPLHERQYRCMMSSQISSVSLTLQVIVCHVPESVIERVGREG